MIKDLISNGESDDSSEEEIILGLDCEWKPQHKGTHERVSLLQLSNGSECWLIRLFCFQDSDHNERPMLPPSLVQLLENPR